MICKKLSISARPVSGLNTYPTGYCIQELATRIQKADAMVPNATSQIMSMCTVGLSFFQPKIQRPRKVDSMKNASSASIASGAPKMSPTNREYVDQFMPNWNSCTIPVTTPMAKLISINFPQNFVMRRYTGFFVRTHEVSMMATIQVMPSVIGTNNQWYTVTMPNCHRARSNAASMNPP